MSIKAGTDLQLQRQCVGWVSRRRNPPLFFSGETKEVGYASLTHPCISPIGYIEAFREEWPSPGGRLSWAAVRSDRYPP